MSLSVLSSLVHVTGSQTIYNPNFSGVGGTSVTRSGDYVLISGAAGSGSGTNVQVTGGPILSIANLSGAGGTQVLSVGGLVIISGGAGVGTVTQAQLDSVSGWAAAQLALTGSTLYQLTVGMSGQAVADYATKSQLTQTGVALEQRDTNISGVLQAQIDLANANPSGFVTTGQTGQFYPKSNPQQYVTSGDLQSTGNYIYTTLTGMSGQAAIDYATKAQLATTGITLTNQVNSLSGFTTGVSGYLQSQITLASAGVTSLNGSSGALNIVGTGGIGVSTAGQTIYVSGQDCVTSGVLAQSGAAILATVAQTGTQAWTAANNNGINLSGVVEATGTTLSRLVTGMSGQAVTDYATKVQLYQTGSNLYAMLVNESGVLVSQIAATGQAAWTHGQNNALNISGNMGATGAALIARDLAISGALQALINQADSDVISINGQQGALLLTGTGNITVISGGPQLIIVSGDTGAYASFATRTDLTQSGVTLGGKIDALSGFVGQVSGGLETRIAQTGAAAVVYVNSISGVLEARIAATGSTAVVHANSIGINLSGALTASGQLLSAVRVTGSPVINVVNLTGLGGTLVIWSGDKIFISGAAGGGAGDVTQAQLNSLSGFTTGVSGALQAQIALSNAGVVSLNGLSGNLNLVGTDGITITPSGQTMWVSGQDSVYVHRTGAELVSGAKTLVDTTQFLSNLRFTAVNQSTSFTFAAGTYRYIWSGAANCTGTLPAASVTSGIEFMVKNLSPTGSLVLSGLIDYSQNYSLTPMQGVTLWSDNTSWLLV